jgi:hypothetical protein
LAEELRQSSATANVAAVADGHGQASAFGNAIPIIDDQWNRNSNHFQT